MAYCNVITPVMFALLFGAKKNEQPAALEAPLPIDLGAPLRALVDELPPELQAYGDLLASFVASGDPSIIDERDESSFERSERRVPYDVARGALGAFAFPHNYGPGGLVRDSSIELTRAEKAARALVLACVDRRNELRDYDPAEKARHRNTLVRNLETARAELFTKGGA